MKLGEEWGREAQTGWVIGLSGDLGAGKTQLVKGIARGLGTPDQVHSPSFALMHQYNGGRVPLFHLDLYRLETHEQIVAAGLEEYFWRPQGVAVIEWAERWFSEVPGSAFRVPGSGFRVPGSGFRVPGSATRYRRVWIEIIDDTGRHIGYEDFGA